MSALSLGALAWVLADAGRAERFLALTGLTPEILRAEIDSVSTHRAVLDFLGAHEPDLIAAAEALGIQPAQLAAVREGLCS